MEWGRGQQSRLRGLQEQRHRGMKWHDVDKIKSVSSKRQRRGGRTSSCLPHKSPQAQGYCWMGAPEKEGSPPFLMSGDLLRDSHFEKYDYVTFRGVLTEVLTMIHDIYYFISSSQWLHDGGTINLNLQMKAGGSEKSSSLPSVTQLVRAEISAAQVCLPPEFLLFLPDTLLALPEDSGLSFQPLSKQWSMWWSRDL